VLWWFKKISTTFLALSGKRGTVLLCKANLFLLERKGFPLLGLSSHLEGIER
jgi:hypothetical protein